MAERRLRVGLVALLLLASCLSGGVAWAWWASVVTAQAPPVSSGSLDLTGGPETGEELLVGTGGTWTYSALTLTGALPAESVARRLVLRSSGTVPLTVSGTAAAASAGLGQDLLLTATRGGAPANTTVDGLRTGTCSGAVLVDRQPVGTGATSFLPDATIAPGQTLTLCVLLGLDGDAPSSVQNQGTTVSFTFTARQADA